MVCYTEPSGKSSLETVWKRAGASKEFPSGDWTNHLSILANFNQSDIRHINPRRAPPAELMGKLLPKKLGRTVKHLQCCSVLFFQWGKTLQFWCIWLCIYVSLSWSHHCCLWTNSHSLLHITLAEGVPRLMALIRTIVVWIQAHSLKADKMDPRVWMITSSRKSSCLTGWDSKCKNPCTDSLFVKIFQFLFFHCCEWVFTCIGTNLMCWPLLCLSTSGRSQRCFLRKDTVSASRSRGPFLSKSFLLSFHFPLLYYSMLCPLAGHMNSCLSLFSLRCAPSLEQLMNKRGGWAWSVSLSTHLTHFSWRRQLQVCGPFT